MTLSIVLQIIILSLGSLGHDVLRRGIISQGLSDLGSMSDEKPQGIFYHVDYLVKLSKVFIMGGLISNGLPKMFNGIEIR